MQETENNHKGILFKEISKISNINPRFHRISSMLLDHIIMTIVTVPILIIIMILMSFEILEFHPKYSYLAFYPTMFIYLNKDLLRAKSPAKRILGYQVVDQKTKGPATELQCFLRNLTIAIAWPLEVIVGYINPERRIGDYIANTKVILDEKEELKSVLTDLKKLKLKPSFLIILIIGVIYFYGFNLTVPHPF